MMPRDRLSHCLSLVTLIGIMALSGCAGWEKPKPSPQRLSQVNQLFDDRYAFVLDTETLLKTDLQADVESPSGDLMPDEAIQRALTHNFSLVTQSESLAIAQANLAQAGLLPNPTLGQTSAFYWPLSGQGGDVAFDLLVTEPINAFFTLPCKQAIAKAQQLQAGIDMASQAFALAQQVQTQYYQLVYIARDGALQRRIAETYKQAVDEAQAQLKAGLVTRADFNRAVIAYEDTLRQAHHYDTQYEGAARQMNWLMGVQSAPRWQLPKSANESPNVIAALPDDQRLEALAGKYRLDLLRASFDNRIADISVKLANLGFIPQTTIGFDAARDGFHNWSAGPQLTSLVLPIFDPGIVAVWLAKYQKQQTERTYITLQGQAKQDVRNALNALQIAAEDVAFYRHVTIPQEEENVKLAQLSFKLGNSQFDDLLNSIREYVGVLQNYEDAIQAYHQAIIGLEAAVGLSFPRIEGEMAGEASKPTGGANSRSINPTGTTTAPALLPQDWLTPHTPFHVADTTQRAASP